MKREHTYLFKLLAAACSILIFWWLESGLKIRSGDELIKSAIFGVCFFVALSKRLRKYLLLVILSLLALMVIMYMFWQIPFASFFGSIGVGILAIFLTSLIPELIKRGYIEKI